jgi:hypothetical protein
MRVYPEVKAVMVYHLVSQAHLLITPAAVAVEVSVVQVV